MILPAAPALFRSRDAELPYRPDSELYYLTGFTEPGAVAVLVGGGHPRLLLFVELQPEARVVWEGARAGPDEAAARTGADECHPLGEMNDRLPAILNGATAIHYRIPAVRSRGGGPDARDPAWPLVTDALARARSVGQKNGTGPRTIIDPGEILDDLRLRKDAGELDALRRAVRASVAGQRAAALAIRPGVSEKEIEGVLEGTFRREGADGSAFAPIVASGPMARVLHYSANDRSVAEGELVLVDAGAEVDLYAGDLTRTYPANGRFSPAQREVYEVVCKARTAALETIRPGALFSELHLAAVQALTAGLIRLGVLQGDCEELVAGRAYRPYFPHGTAHWLGLDVHDPGDYRREGESRPLSEGMVLTVEPGLYFPLESDATTRAERRYAGMGVRVEDDVLVTREGMEVLSADLPVGAEEVEAMVRGE